MPSGQMPRFLYLYIFDGIPPIEEGEDPTLFASFPLDQEKDKVINEVGVFLTFHAFCSSFKPSKSVQGIETDKNVSVFCDLGAHVFCSATFEKKAKTSLSVAIKMMELFKVVFLQLFEPFRRNTKTNQIENFLMVDVSKNLPSICNIFRFPPSFSRFSITSDLQIKCQELIIEASSIIPFSIFVFFFQESLLYSNILPSEAQGILMNFKVKADRFVHNSKNSKDNSAQWIVFPCDDETQTDCYRPPFFHKGNPMIPYGLCYHDLLLFFARDDDKIAGAKLILLENAILKSVGELFLSLQGIPTLISKDKKFHLLNGFCSKECVDDFDLFDLIRETENYTDQFLLFSGARGENKFVLQKSEDEIMYSEKNVESLEDYLLSIGQFKND